jgi:hypothetical protein
MKWLLAAVSVLGASTYRAPEAHAEETVTSPSGYVWWSTVASGCVLDTRTSQPAAVNSQAGTVSFLSGQTGTIYLSCPVTVPPPSANCYYLDLSASGPEGSVDAYLNYLPWASAGANITNVSNLSTSQSLTEQPWPGADTPANFNLATAWFVVTITRSNTTNNPIFYGVALAYNPGLCD